MDTPKNIRGMIEEYIRDTGEAHFEHRQGEGYGVVFHDENEFFLLSDLAYNSNLGFFRVSRFPGEPREAEYQEPEPAKWSTVVFTENDGEQDYQSYGVVPDDGTSGLIIGELPHVRLLYEALGRLLESGHADEEVHHLDERLGHPWLSVSEASEKFNVPTDTVRYAAREGFIPMAEKQGRDWRFPQRKFLWWLAKVYKPRS